MSSDLPRYTLRVQRTLLDKIRYIAEENGRSANKEIELLIKQRIRNYELKNGNIEIDPNNYYEG